MITILLRELKDRRIALLAYCFVAVALLVTYMSIFPSVHDQMTQFQKLYESYPQGLYKALGIQNLSVSTLENFLAIEQFSIVWPVLAILFSASIAGASIAGQIERGTIGFYLALPLPRIKLFVAKYAAGILGACMFVLASIMTIAPLAKLFHSSVSVHNLVSISLVSAAFMLAVYSFAMLLSACFSERSKTYMLLGGILIGMYVANIVAELKTSLSWLAHYSIFHYYNAQDVLSTGHIHRSSILVFVGTAVVSTALAIIVFRRRDIAV